MLPSKQTSDAFGVLERHLGYDESWQLEKKSQSTKPHLPTHLLCDWLAVTCKSVSRRKLKEALMLCVQHPVIRCI